MSFTTSGVSRAGSRPWRLARLAHHQIAEARAGCNSGQPEQARRRVERPAARSTSFHRFRQLAIAEELVNCVAAS